MFDAFILPGTPPLLFWILVAVAIVIQGISKSGFAGGAGILSLPLMMLVMPVDKVAATLLPLLILCDLNAIYHHRNHKAWTQIRRVYFPACVGILLGAAVWWQIGQEGIAFYGPLIKRMVGVIAILFGLYIIAKDRSMAWVEHHRAGRRTALVAGVLAGFTSTIAHAAGPIVSLYIYSQGFGKTLFVGTVAWTFTLINMTKLPFYAATGLIKTDVLLFDACLVALIPIGSWLGHWMHHRVSEWWFSRIIMVFTLVAGVQLLLK
ncbi:MAG: sulfite exporter TauE/SafE family protein [Candidatus Hydrogenedentes bacterium]|nr:sulfite exporter TauE/SafE family protein [Candidatus Hydrogenedentota bacterium]